MKRILLLSVLMLTPLFASGGSIQDTDFIERSINFVIFVAVLYYLVFGKIKALFAQRAKKIAKDFDEVDKKAQHSIELKNDALKRLDQAKERAAEMVSFAKKEAHNIAQRSHEQSNIELANLDVSFNNTKEFEEKKMIKNSIEKVLANLENDIALSKEDYAKIITKRIA